MRFTPQFLDELKARLPVSEVVGRRVKLQRSGRELKGPVAVQQGEDAVLLRQRPEGGLVRFLLGQERQHLRFRHADRRRHLPGGGRAAGADGRRGAAESLARGPARDARRKTLHDVMDLAAKFFETTLASRAGAKARGYLADRGLDPATQLKFRLGYATVRALRAEGASGQPRHSGRGHGRGRPADRRRRHPGAVRPFPRPRDVPDHRSARPRHRLRRPRHGEGCAGEISQFAGDAALS